MITVAKFQTLTLGGKIIDMENPDPDQITLEDIATGLSNVCRFSGQVSQFYSVAQHCMDVAFRLSPKKRRYALLHDASEAYIGDVPRPVKLLCPEYKAVERRLTEAIFERFQIVVGPGWNRALKEEDSRCLMTEARDLKLGEVDWLDVPFTPYEDIVLQPLSAKQAKKSWLCMAHGLGLS